MGRQEKNSALLDFSEKEVANIGARVEGILFEANPLWQNVRILEYLRIYIEFRKATQENIKFSMEKLDDAKKRLTLREEQVYALNLWARGSRKNAKDILTEGELDFLYERICKKLKELDESPS